jgi:hypothetical protein
MTEMILVDPITGFAVRVGGEPPHTYLNVEATDLALIGHISMQDELAFVWANATYDTDAADTVLLVKNTDADRDLYIHKYTIWTDTATRVTVHTTNGVAFTPTGTAVTGVNTNRKSGKTASATAIGDETANTQGNIVGEFYAEANKTNHYDFDDIIVLGNGNSIGADIVTAGTGAIVAFYGFYRKPR